MKNWIQRTVIISLIFFVGYAQAQCSVTGTSPPITVNASVLDIHEGIFWQGGTTNIAVIHITEHDANTGNREYMSTDLVDSDFVVATTALFKEYEEHETSHLTYISVTFDCTSGSNDFPLSIAIHVIDTNNHAPEFILPPSGEYVFTIFTPVPPGHDITGCLNHITVRDIDLTTIKIDFEFEDNLYFEIDYDDAASTTDKEFKAKLVTKTFLRNLPNPIVLKIIATDVDKTGDPRQTAETTVTIIANTEFELPEEPVFSKTFYLAEYTSDDQVILTEPITLQSGYDQHVRFYVQESNGVNSDRFELLSDPDHENQKSIHVLRPLKDEDLMQDYIHLIVRAEREHTSGASATVVLRLPKVVPLEFDRAHYQGTIENNNLDSPQLILRQGYEGETVTAAVRNEYSTYFTATVEGNKVTLTMGSLDENILEENSFLTLEVYATTGRSTTTTIVTLEIIKEDNVTPVFASSLYKGTYSSTGGLTHDRIELVQGYDGVEEVTLLGDYKDYFRAKRNGSVVVIETTDDSLEIYNEERIVLSLVARKPRTVGASTAVIITLPADLTDQVVMRFAQNTYTGTIDSSGLSVDDIVLSSGYAPGTEFILTGEHDIHFKLTPNKEKVSLSLRGSLSIDTIDDTFIVLEIEAKRERAVSVSTSVVIEIIRQEVVSLVFKQPFYRGVYNAESGLEFNEVISLLYGFDDTVFFTLEGDLHSLFKLVPNGTNSLSIETIRPISNDVLQTYSHLLFTVVATKPGALTTRSAIFIAIEKDSQTEEDVKFERVFYEGFIQQNEVQHELITVTGYYGTSVQLLGELSSLFVGRVSDGEVRVQAASEPLTLPTDLTHLTLEMHVAGARAVLLLNVLPSDVPLLPSVTFSSNSYMMTVDMAQTGLVGRVSATADNGEAVTYSLEIDDAHLLSRVFINNEGELHLSAPANSGVYTIEVIAATVITQARATAPVHLRVEAVLVCDDKGIVTHPLIILDRDEEAAHNNLVVFDATEHAGCHFTLTNHWPTDQTWLYVDENGLHTTAIDREHSSIAFMAFSQVQVELILHCDSDSAVREKRSERTDRLGPYDYSRNKWIFTDTITYNSRRSLVNLIVNDINDNYPIFVGKEHEPIAVGYPTEELEERVLPRSLAELQATDADIGENAALRYWSSESVLAVAPATGFVHVRAGARLAPDQLLTVTATDQNGQGLSGTIQLLVKLLDINHLAVVTVRGAFLDDETNVLTQLSDAVGYEVKSLRSVVISDAIGEDAARNTRDVTRASLQLYIYGIKEREPVVVEYLVGDIISNASLVQVVSTIPLKEHLEDMNMSDNQIGLLASTIVLSVLLFAVILIVAIWFFLRWRKDKKYDEFNDENSLTSRNTSLGELPKPEVAKPRLNIEDLKKSEKRLQEMLHASIENVTVEPVPRNIETPAEAILDLPIHEPNAFIVIQSIDKLKDADESSDDEFGEDRATPRKSIVTFNKNVEKIIHVEDNVDEDGDNDDNIDINVSYNVDALNTRYEIHKL